MQLLLMNKITAKLYALMPLQLEYTNMSVINDYRDGKNYFTEIYFLFLLLFQAFSIGYSKTL